MKSSLLMALLFASLLPAAGCMPDAGPDEGVRYSCSSGADCAEEGYSCTGLGYAPLKGGSCGAGDGLSFFAEEENCYYPYCRRDEMDTKFCGAGFCEDNASCVFDLSINAPQCLNNDALYNEVSDTGTDCGNGASYVIVVGLLDDLDADESLSFDDVCRCVSDSDFEDITPVPSSD